MSSENFNSIKVVVLVSLVKSRVLRELRFTVFVKWLVDAESEIFLRFLSDYLFTFCLGCYVVSFSKMSFSRKTLSYHSLIIPRLVLSRF